MLSADRRQALHRQARRAARAPPTSTTPTTLPNGTISVFDNGAVPKVHPQSRGLVLSLDRAPAPSRRGRAVRAHARRCSSGSQGNIQPLANGNMFVGWGSEPYFSEYSASGQLLFDAHMHGSYQSYRALPLPLDGRAGRARPAIAAAPAPGGRATVYASWNGDTRTASWRVLAGASAQTLAPVATAARSGFETAADDARRRRRTSPCRRSTPRGAVLGSLAHDPAAEPRSADRRAARVGTLWSFDVKEGFSTGGHQT